MICDDCGNELVEVDNPMRREVRHKRGVVCTPLTAEQRAKLDESLRSMVLIKTSDRLRNFNLRDLRAVGNEDPERTQQR